MSGSSKLPVLVMLLFIIAVQVIALAITPAISSSGERVFEDPASTANPFVYVITILAFTAFLLLAMRLKKGWAVSGFIQLSIAASIFYVLAVFMPPLLALLPTLAVMLLLHYYPEWYIVDAFGIIVCSGISSLFGVSMDPLPTILLLIILAVYDAISVYRTRHMISLAEGVIKMKAPLLFIVPKSRSYSFRTDQFSSSTSIPVPQSDPNPGSSNSTSMSATESAIASIPAQKEGADKAASQRPGSRRGAYFLGLGDAIIPSILVISAYVAFPGDGLFGLNYPAAGAMFGTYIGFLLLMTTTREKPQAGLPFLNTGVILGFLAGCAAAGIWPF